MTCEDVRRALAGGDAPGDAHRAHARQCEACAELLAGGQRLADALKTGQDAPARSVELSRLGQSVLAEIAQETGPVASLRGARTASRCALALAAAAVVVAVTALGLPRADFSVYPMFRLGLSAAVLATLLVVVVAVALRPLHAPPMPAWKERVWLALSVLLPLVVAALPAAHQDHAASLFGAGEDLVPKALRCFVFGGALALPIFYSLRLLDRSAHGTLLPMLAAAGAVGLVGNLVLHFHCPITHPSHLVLGHASIGVAAMTAALLWARRSYRRLL